MNPFRLAAGLASQACFIAVFAVTAFAQSYQVGTIRAGDPGGRGALLASDRAGNLYHAGATSGVRRFSPDGGVTVLSNRPVVALAVDAAGNVYVVAQGEHAVERLTPQGAVLLAGHRTEAADVDGIGANARFNHPASLAADAAGNVWVWCGSQALRRITAAGVVSTVLTQETSTSDPVYVAALAVDPDGNVLAADSIRHVIWRVTPAGRASVLAGERSTPGSRDGTGAGARFRAPRGIAAADNGDIFVADTENATVRRISAGGVVTTLAGQPDGTRESRDGVGGNARFLQPRSLTAGTLGRLWVVEEGGAIRELAPVASPGPPILTEPPVANVPGGQRHVGARSTLSFTAAAAGAAPVTYQWNKDGVPIPGATSPSFTIASVETTDEARYSVTVRNAAGAFSSSGVAVRVYSPAFESFTVRHATTGGSFLWGIASGQGQLVAVGTGGTILTSPDGRTWTRRDSGTSEWLVGVAFGAGQFVAVGDKGTILNSANGVNWFRASAVPTTQRLNNVAHAGTSFVAVGEGGAALSSSDGRVWVAESTGVNTWLRGLVYVPLVATGRYVTGDNGTGRFYAAGQNGVILERLARADAGVAWVRSPVFSGLGSRDIEALGSGPMGIGQDGLLVNLNSFTIYSKLPLRMPDGTWEPVGGSQHSWMEHSLGIAARFRGIARGAGAIFATGENGVIAGAQSVGGPWSVIPTGTTANLVSGVFHGNSLYVVGENETIVQSEPLYQSRLINLATRGRVDAANALVSGFVVSGDRPKSILLRAAGPALAEFRVADALSAPVLSLFDGASRPLATNSGWSNAANATAIAAAAARVGAFPFRSGAADSAMLVTLPPGAYTAHVTGQGGARGVTLVEAYDAEPPGDEGARAINISTRGQVGDDSNRLIAGFVISGAASRRVLIRAVGPSLAQFGLGDLLAQPQLELHYTYGLWARANAWSRQPNADELRAAMSIAGAFPLVEDSDDAVLVVELPPGNYTAQVSGFNGNTGTAIVEVYDLP